MLCKANNVIALVTFLLMQIHYCVSRFVALIFNLIGYPLDTGYKLSVHNTCRIRPWCFCNVLYTFDFRSVFREWGWLPTSCILNILTENNGYLKYIQTWSWTKFQLCLACNFNVDFQTRRYIIVPTLINLSLAFCCLVLLKFKFLTSHNHWYINRLLCEEY